MFAFHGYCQAATLWFLRSSRIGSMVFHESEGLGRASSEGEHHTVARNKNKREKRVSLLASMLLVWFSI